MSEGLEPGSGLPVPDIADGARRAGQLLKQAREEVGVHIGALAVGLKVPVRKLEALEAGDLESLSGPVFVRALAASVCRHLKVDATEVLSLLPLAVAVPLSQPSELKTPFRVPGEAAGQSVMSQYLTMPVLAVLALLIAALAVAFWPQKQQVEETGAEIPEQTIKESAVNPAALAPTEAAPNTSAPVAASPVAMTDSSKAKPSVAVSAPAVAVPSTAPATAPMAAAPNAAAPNASSPALVAPVSAASAPARGVSAPAVLLAKVPAGLPVAGEAGILQFKVRDSSWIEVVDGKGVTVLRKTMETGETAHAAGALPLRVVIGRVDVTEVHVRGRKLDMQTVSKDNVARFEVAQ